MKMMIPGGVVVVAVVGSTDDRRQMLLLSVCVCVYHAIPSSLVLRACSCAQAPTHHYHPVTHSAASTKSTWNYSRLPTAHYPLPTTSQLPTLTLYCSVLCVCVCACVQPPPPPPPEHHHHHQHFPPPPSTLFTTQHTQHSLNALNSHEPPSRLLQQQVQSKTIPSIIILRPRTRLLPTSTTVTLTSVKILVHNLILQTTTQISLNNHILTTPITHSQFQSFESSVDRTIPYLHSKSHPPTTSAP